MFYNNVVEVRMKKQNKNETSDSKKYYDINVKAVNELAEAMNEKPKFNEKLPKDAPNPYKIDFLARIPTWIKVVFIKFWIGGAICYFGFFGLGAYVPGILDLQVLVGLITGIVNDFLVNPGFLYFESDQKEYHKYLMIPISGKRIWTLLVNIAYGIIITLIVAQIYYFINVVVVVFKDLPKDTITIPVEPIGYGIILLLVDLFFVSIKNYIVKIAKR